MTPYPKKKILQNKRKEKEKQQVKNSTTLGSAGGFRSNKGGNINIWFWHESSFLDYKIITHFGVLV